MTFKNKHLGNIRTVRINNTIYFVGNDLTKALGLSNSILTDLGATKHGTLLLLDKAGAVSLVKRSSLSSKVIMVVISAIMAFGGGFFHKPTHANTSTNQTISQEATQGKRMIVKATAYAGDTITSTGTKPKVGRTIAVDPKVIPYGTRVYIPQFNKVFIAEDCGSAIKGNRIDIFMRTEQECNNWGIQEIEIIILNN